MKSLIAASSTVLLAWFFTSAPPLAAVPGPGHIVTSSSRGKMSGIESHQQLGGRDLVKGDTNEFPESHELGVEAAGRAFRHGMGSVAGIFRRPSGWDKGKKVGWDGASTPPGLSKKQSLPSKFVHRGMFFHHGESAFANRDITRLQVANFDRFLDLHPGLERSLMQNPTLIHNQAFLAAHPPLAAWLRAHPQAAEELRENPQAFMRAEARFERGGNDITRRELARFDNFLDSHPAISRQLAVNPALINNPQYLQQHSQLQQFLQTHPGIREELTENPQAFMERERLFEAHEGLEQRFEAGGPEESEASNNH